jgi:transcriptional regulator with XRE-family HTH domain
MASGITKEEAKQKISELQAKGWTLASVADELSVTVNGVEKWKAGDRHPNNAKAILLLPDQIAKRKRIPKKRRYEKGRGQ